MIDVIFCLMAFILYIKCQINYSRMCYFYYNIRECVEDACKASISGHCERNASCAYVHDDNLFQYESMDTIHNKMELNYNVQLGSMKL